LPPAHRAKTQAWDFAPAGARNVSITYTSDDDITLQWSETEENPTAQIGMQTDDSEEPGIVKKVSSFLVKVLSIVDLPSDWDTSLKNTLERLSADSVDGQKVIPSLNITENMNLLAGQGAIAYLFISAPKTEWTYERWLDSTPRDGFPDTAEREEPANVTTTPASTFGSVLEPYWME